MAIPPEYGGDLFLWFNDVVGHLSAANSELMCLRHYWAQLTDAQKTGMKNAMQTRLADAQTSLTQIATEIATL